MAVGTHGQGDQCAPSHLFNSVISYGGGLDVMVQYEIAAVYAAVAQGIGVVVTDYQGLGTPAVHGYLNRVAQAHAVLDAARAAIDLKSLPADTPVGMWGYSQGGERWPVPPSCRLPMRPNSTFAVPTPAHHLSIP